ncbi:MAG: hypothetical protein GWN29_04025, partial [Gammaproteobacteria bacterium]|nr:hypothetical protein [Gammaproteobacteria bacterium]
MSARRSRKIYHSLTVNDQRAYRMFASRVTLAALAAVVISSTTDAQTRSDWPTFGGAPGGAQHSALDQINVDNVGEL